MLSSKSEKILLFIFAAASSNSSIVNLGRLAKTTLFIFDESKDQFERPIIGTYDLSSKILCKTFSGFDGEASARPISSRIKAIKDFCDSSWFNFSDVVFSSYFASLKAFSRLSGVERAEH